MCCCQVYGQQTRLQKYCKFFRKQRTIDKFDAVIQQLDEHSERAWQLADSSKTLLRRRGMRASFSQGLQRNSSDSAPTDSAVLDNAYGSGSCVTLHLTGVCAVTAGHPGACSPTFTRSLYTFVAPHYCQHMC